MKKKTIHYTDEPIKLGKRVKDFLPSPEELKNAPIVMRVDAPVALDLYNKIAAYAKKQKTSVEDLIGKLIERSAARL